MSVPRLLLNQLHIGKWSTIWPLLDAAMRIPGFCSEGVVIFGGWHASPPRDADDLAEVPADLLHLLLGYRIYCITVKLVAVLKASETGDEYKSNSTALGGWINKHRKWFGMLTKDPEDIEAIERLAKQSVEDLPTLIHNMLLNMERRVFVFAPLPEDTSAGWRSLYEFGDAYRRLPSHIIAEFGDYFFEIRIPSAGS